jgi:hypothetical protein
VAARSAFAHVSGDPGEPDSGLWGWLQGTFGDTPGEANRSGQLSGLSAPPRVDTPNHNRPGKTARQLLEVFLVGGVHG